MVSPTQLCWRYHSSPLRQQFDAYREPVMRKMLPWNFIMIRNFNTLRPGQDGCHYADEIFKCILLIKCFVFWLKFHWNWFLKVQSTINQDWFRWWLGAKQATSHYLNLWWTCSLVPYGVTRPQWVNQCRELGQHWFSWWLDAWWHCPELMLIW